MSDITDRLRGSTPEGRHSDAATLDEAAAEIEQLRAAIRWLDEIYDPRFAPVGISETIARLRETDDG